MVFKIPSDFCYDPEDGSRVGLGVRKLKDFQPWGDDFWMQFDERNGEVFGVPMEAGEFFLVVFTVVMENNLCCHAKKRLLLP